jgi:DNA-binding response OmpR family regulator
MSQQDPVLLALDDDQDIVETMSALAVRAGFRAVSSTSSSQLRELLESARPDVIILDLQMPGEDGVSVLRHLADVQSQATIFLVTGMDERTIASAEQYGLRRGLKVAGTLQKPFDPAELLVRLERAHAAVRPLTATDLERAIENGELVVHYQPIIRRFADDT